MKRLASILTVGIVCLAVAGTAHAANVTWTGTEDNIWDITTENWTGDATVYTAGDDAFIDDTTSGTIVMAVVMHNANEPNSVLFDIDVNRSLSWNPPGHTWSGDNGFAGGTITKSGTGTLSYTGTMGFWATPTGSPVFNINEGVLYTGHQDETGSGTFGSSGVVMNLSGGEYWYGETWGAGQTFSGVNFHVTGDSNIRISKSKVTGWARNDVEVHIDAGATLTLIELNGKVHWDNKLTIDLTDDSSGTMAILSDLVLQDGNVDSSALTLNVTGTQTQTEYVLIEHGAAIVDGNFVTVTGLPDGAFLDYDGTDTYPNAIVLVIPPSLIPGDLNGDGNVDNLDITAFVDALTKTEAEFEALYPDGEYWAGDIDEDGNVDNIDITPFVVLLTGGGAQVPEPATTALLVLSALGVVIRRKRK